MAPIKLEDNIREKLEEREIKPSANAWDKLESQLDSAQPKSKKVVWYYIAASFVGILLLGSVFFNQNQSTTDTERFVEQPIQQEKLEKNEEIIPNKINSEEIASEEINSELNNSEEKEKQETKNIKPVIQTKKSEVEEKIQKTEAVAEVSKEEMQPVKTETQVVLEEEKLFKNKINEVVAQVQKLQSENNEVTVDEVDALLRNARREIQSQRILNNPKVDATALLQDVEGELERSFRDKVFDALGEGFQKVRTAVSERNN